jgi:hypothetical protein
MLQLKIANAENPLAFMPEISELPENLPSSIFETAFGGIGGKRTRDLFKEIDRRVNTCDGLKLDLQ